MADRHGLATGIFIMCATLLPVMMGWAQERWLYNSQTQHPRLICTADELETVRQRLSNPVEAAAYKELLRRCDMYLDPASPNYVNWLEQNNPMRWDSDQDANMWEVRAGAWMLTRRFEELTWAGVLSRDQKYIDGAKNIVFTIIRERVIDRVAGTNYGQPYGGWLAQPLDAGHSSRSYAIFYDLLYNDLTEAERKEVREYIIGTYFSYLAKYFTDAKESAAYPGNMGHNFSLIGNSAACLNALAFYGETGRSAEQEDEWVKLFFEGIDVGVHVGIGEDGGALEGPGYTSADLYYTTFVAEAMRRAGGPDLFDAGPMANIPYYYLYEMRPNAQFFNNINDSWFEAHTSYLPLYSYVLDDPAISWMWNRLVGNLDTGSNIFGDTFSDWQSSLPYIILWNALAPQGEDPETLGFELSRKFSRRGLVSMRSSWDGDGVLMSFLSGGQPAYGHSQHDANHFAIYAGAAVLAYDSGYGARDTEDHNSLLIDGAGQTEVAKEGRISLYEPGEIATYAVGSAGDLYGKPWLQKYDRHVYFCHDRAQPYAVVYDEVLADATEHRYSWTLNITNDSHFDLSGDHPVVLDKSGWQLDILMSAAGEVVFTEGENGVQSSRVAPVVNHPIMYADLVTDLPPGFIAVLIPNRGDSELPEVTRINAHAVRVEWADYIDLVAFGPAETPEMATKDHAFVRVTK